MITSASLNTAFCSLASSTLIGWQKANPHLSASPFSKEDAFRSMVGLDWNPPPNRLSFQHLQDFLGRLETHRHQFEKTETELPDWFTSALAYSPQSKEVEGETDPHFQRMLAGVQNLFDLYPEVHQRHLLLSDSCDDDGFVAADYLMAKPLLPGDRQRGELLQLALEPAPSEPDRVRKLIEEHQQSIIKDIQKQFPFVAIRPSDFVNGRLVRVTIRIRVDLDPLRCQDFFLSEAGRFVTSLNLDGRTSSEPLSPALITKLFQGSWARSLRGLSLFNTNIGPEGARAIADSQALANLTRLDLWDNNIGDNGARAIADSQTLANLTTLDLGGNNLGPDGARAIANAPSLAKLTTLNLAYNNLGPDGARAIREWAAGRVTVYL